MHILEGILRNKFNFFEQRENLESKEYNLGYKHDQIDSIQDKFP